MSYRVEFTTVDDLIKKIDEKIDETGYGKVDVYLEDEDQFKEEEVGKLEEEFIQMVQCHGRVFRSSVENGQVHV